MTDNKMNKMLSDRINKIFANEEINNKWNGFNSMNIFLNGIIQINVWNYNNRKNLPEHWEYTCYIKDRIITIEIIWNKNNTINFRIYYAAIIQYNKIIYCEKDAIEAFNNLMVEYENFLKLAKNDL